MVYFYFGYYRRTNDENDDHEGDNVDEITTKVKKTTDDSLRQMTSILHPVRCDFLRHLNCCDNQCNNGGENNNQNQGTSDIFRADSMVIRDNGIYLKHTSHLHCFQLSRNNVLKSKMIPLKQTAIESFCVSSFDSIYCVTTLKGNNYKQKWLCLLTKDGSYEKLKHLFAVDDVKVLNAGRKIKIFVKRDNSVFQFNDDKYPIKFTPVELPLKKEILSIACGMEHAIILTNDFKVWSIGNGSRAQLGLGDQLYASSFVMIKTLDYFNIQSISVGGWHNLVLTDNGDIYAWGWNESGQVGALHLNESGDDLSTTPTDTKLYFTPSLVDTPLTKSFQKISTGFRHSVAITTNGELFSWGWNSYGQLCHEDTKDYLKPTKVKFFKNIPVSDVTCGGWCTLVATCTYVL